MFANPKYRIPKPPSRETYFAILRDFYNIESKFSNNKFFFVQLVDSQTVGKQ